LKTPSEYVPGEAKYPRILTYHEVSNRFHLGINCVRPKVFRSHIEFIKSAEIPFTPLKGLSDGARSHTVSFTFDDGYESFYDEVFPILIECKIPATVFIITEHVGKTNDWDLTLGVNRRRHLSWPQISEISDAGIEIGSHSRFHRDLTRLSDTALDAELLSSKEIIEDNIGREVTSLALPFGRASIEVFEAARKIGYREICGSSPGLSGPFPGILPRMPVYRGDGIGALRRKLEMNFMEILRLRMLQGCSSPTRIIKI
jgi:peptidoglycan/xylan/chitin deacetylase (PgdA/CDA1 family)